MEEKQVDYEQAILAGVRERLDLTSEVSEEELTAMIDGAIMEASRKNMISVVRREEIRRNVFNAMKRFGILQRLLDDDGITEIMVNGPEHIFIEREGRIVESGLHFSGGQELEDVVQRIAANSDRMVNASSPILDTRLADGSRVNIVLNPISLDGTTVTIRKFYETPLTMERLIQINSITREAADFLQRAIRARYNIFISGGTGSGKTTFLNALSNYIPMDERIITIEDSAELQIRNVGGRQRNLVRLETRNANLEGENQVSIRDLIKSSLRMRPDRIIVGEIRGGEAIDMLQAMNTGMEGSMSTGHANSARDMLSRMETMVLMGMEIPVAAIRSQIGSAVDILVHLGRLRDKTRRVLEIVEILGCVDGEIRTATLYEFQETDGAGKAAGGQVFGTLVKRGELANRAKLRMYGMEG
jgi:pilus assembly protein CpaF